MKTINFSKTINKCPLCGSDKKFKQLQCVLKEQGVIRVKCLSCNKKIKFINCPIISRCV